MKEIRNMFPALNQEFFGKKLVYFDNAATSQKPLSVIELQQRISSLTNANIHRAVHHLSAEATELYEKGREAVRAFIGAGSREEIIFTSGATAGFNLLASSFVQKFVGEGDKVLVSEAEHHSNIVPWQLACERAGAELVVLKVEENGEIDSGRFEQMLDERVKIVSIAHISNVLGVVNPISDIVRIAHKHGIPVAVDGAQGVVHSKVDVQALDCDFYIFSGHKIFAPTGTGVLYGKRELLEAMPPYMGGGDMVDTVTFEKTTYAGLPLKFEAGTPNFTAAACYAPALELAAALREDPQVQEDERQMTARMMERMGEIDGLRIYGLPADQAAKAPVFSMTVEGCHPSDIAQLLDKMGVAVRSGLMCAEPLIRRWSDKGMLRASLMPYNTVEEVDYFAESLKRAVRMLR